MTFILFYGKILIIITESFYHLLYLGDEQMNKLCFGDIHRIHYICLAALMEIAKFVYIYTFYHCHIDDEIYDYNQISSVTFLMHSLLMKMQLDMDYGSHRGSPPPK